MGIWVAALVDLHGYELRMANRRLPRYGMQGEVEAYLGKLAVTIEDMELNHNNASLLT